MDFTAVSFFLMLCYVRPHEWIGMVESLRVTAFSLLFAIAATLMRERGFTVKSMFQTPHDWTIVFYFFWIILSSLAFIETWKAVYAYMAYYFIAVQALSSLQRIRYFLAWWAGIILFICVFAIASEFGFDPTDAADITHGVMKGRLILNTSIFNNPNALGHGVIPVLVMLYFLMIWKRPIFAKIFSIPLIFIALYCLYLTQSKGAFLAAFSGILVALTFNRPKIMQALILLLAGTLGWAAMHALPRMHELDKAASDQAIQGRVAAFKFGLGKMHHSIRGVGYCNFVPAFEAEHHYSKASHSSYVEIGGEFGWIGLTLFLFILYCCYRTLLTCKTRDVEEERTRRILITMLVTYTVSSWMVDFAFRASFFLMVATIAAFHRYLMGMTAASAVQADQAEEFVPAGVRPVRMAFPELVPAGGADMFAMRRLPRPDFNRTTINVGPEEKEEPEKGIDWNRIGILDVILVIIFSLLWERLWRYLIHVV